MEPMSVLEKAHFRAQLVTMIRSIGLDNTLNLLSQAVRDITVQDFAGTNKFSEAAMLAQRIADNIEKVREAIR